MNKETQEQKEGILTIRASYFQERLWFIDTFERGELYECGPLYHNVPFILEIKGIPNLHFLEEGLKFLIKRHEALRTRMVIVDNQLYQQVEPEMEIKVRVKDISLETGKALLEAAIEESRTPFLIAGGPLIRAALIRAAGTGSFLVITLHHIITDAYSLKIIYHELASIYRALAAGLSPVLADIPLHYADFSNWQRELPEEFLEPLLFYWKRQLAGLKPLELPTDNPRAPIHIFQQARESFQWDREFCTGIKEFCRKRDIESWVLVLAAFKVLLHRYCDQEDITVGTVDHNRHLQGTGNLVGPAANLLVLRSLITGNPSSLMLVEQLAHTLQDAGHYRDIPFDWLAAQLNPEQDMSRTVFFDVLFQYDPRPLPVETAGNLEIHYHETNLGWGKYDLNLLLQDNGQTITGYLVYNAEYYKKSTVLRLLGHYHMLLRGILENPHQPAASIPLLTAEEKKQLLIDWDQTGVSYPRDTTIVDIFSRQAEAAPHTTAVVYENQSLTYGGLNQKSRDLAEDLKRKGVRPETIVGLLLERSLEVITGIVGILKTGGTYLPIDPDYPQERIDYMLADSGTRILVSEVSKVSEVSEGIEIIDIHQIKSKVDVPTPLTQHTHPTQLSLAYIIYTSGTTGRPKGVMVEHRNLVRLFFNDQFPFDFNNSDIWTMFHSPCFDFSVWEIWGPLLYGGKLIVISKLAAQDTAYFLHLLRLHEVTVLNQTPSAFYSLIHQELQQGSNRETLNLRYVIFGGEALSPVRLKQWHHKYPGTKLVNMFGITETTVHVTWKEITADDINRNLNIVGKPLPTLSVYIQNPRRELLPIGIFGEIVIGGLGVSRGYLNQPLLTNEKFLRGGEKREAEKLGRWEDGKLRSELRSISHPQPETNENQHQRFAQHIGPPRRGAPGRRRQKIYKSGDRGRFLENGDIQYAGRIDLQVQIRGFRVEPGEIENTLLNIKGIKEAVVTAGEDKPGDIYLCAYIVGEDRLDIPGLRRCLGERLPGYMIPAYFVQVEAIPLDPNGKVNRRTLPSPQLKVGPGKYIGPASTLESRLVKIWSRVLGIQQELISVEANFFQLGGHSLKATVLMANIHQELDVKIPLADIFKAPTIREMARIIKSVTRSERARLFASIEPVEKKEYYLLSPAQKRLYILQQLVPGTTGYNVSYPVNLEGEIHMDRLEKVFQSMVARHDSLRTSFVVINRQPFQRVHETVDFSIEHHETVGQDPGEVIYRFIRPFDLTELPLFRIHLIDTGTQVWLLLMDMHHIITDAASLGILQQEFRALYLHHQQELPFLRLQYKDYSEWQASSVRQNALKQQQAFWLEEFAPAPGSDAGNELPVMNLPLDYPRPLMQSFEGNQFSFAFSVDETKIIKKIAQDNEITLFMTLLAVFNILFSKLSSQEDIILGTPIAARVHADLQQVTGMFVNTIALRNFPAAHKTFNAFLQEIKERILKAFENQEYPFEELVEHLVVHRDTSRNPVFDVMFNWISQGEAPGTLDEAEAREIREFSSEPWKHRESTARFDLVFSALERGDHIHFTLEYSTRLFKTSTIDRFINYLRTLVLQLPANTNARLSDLGIIPREEILEILQLSRGKQSGETQESTIPQWFEHQVKKNLHHTALLESKEEASFGRVLNAGGEMHLSYKELNKKANQLAHLLREKRIGPESVVGLMLERSVEMIIGILGILKAGGVYLPIDPGYPGERISTVLNDSSAPLLLTSGNLLGQISITKVKNMKPGGETVTITPAREQIKDFDKLPIPDRTLIDYRKYHQYIGEAPAKHTITLQSTRGCPYHCLYCHKIWPKIHVARRAEHILQEISYAYDAGLRRFVFIDDIFNLDQANAARFLESIIKRKMDIQLFFPNGFRADLLDRDFIDLMAAAGTVNLDVALESASPRIQKLIRKHLNLEKFKENVHYITKKYPQVILEMEIMHGFPTESQEEALMTLEFLKQFQWVHFPNLHVLKIFPNTDMCKLAMEHGITEEAIERSANLAFHELPDTLPFDKSFTRGFQARFMAEYFLLKKRLLDILPYQMRVLTQDELVQKYDSYLPFEVKDFNDILGYAGIDRSELGDTQFIKEDQYQALDFGRKISRYFPVKPQVPTRTAFRILLLDLSQLFTEDHETMLHHQIEEPLGLLYLMTYLNEKFKERIHGQVFKSRIDFDSFDELKLIVMDFKPDLIGIRTLSFYKEFFHKTTAMIRQWQGDVPIIAGGPYATSDYRLILQDSNVDLVVLGEGELTLAQLVEKMMENHNQLPGEDVLQKIRGIALIKNKSTAAHPKQEPPQHKHTRNYNSYNGKDREIVMLDQVSERLAGYPQQDPGHVNHCHDLLYVIYTSGSTGQPKGVMLEHRNLANLIRYQYHHTNIDFSRVLQFTTIAFDVAAQEIFSTLLAGGQLSLVSRETITDVPGLFKKVEKDYIRTLFLPTSFLKFVMKEADFLQLVSPSVNHIVTAGEQLIVNDGLKRYLRESRIYLHNHYGPSETHVVTALTLEPTGDIPTCPSIGRPVLNTTINILDKGMNPVPIKVVGELFIGGVQVGRGYLNNPELTREKFDHDLWDYRDYQDKKKNYKLQNTKYKQIPNYKIQITNKEAPCGRILNASGKATTHHSPLTTPPLYHSPIYRTGDLACWLEGGNIEFLGRIDSQVKIRGFRVELGEIENRLLNHPGVKETVVQAKIAVSGETYLCAYIVPGGEPDTSQLRQYLSRNLPGYMIPSYFLILEKIPLTVNGKIDRRSLPDPQLKANGKYIAPMNNDEKTLIKLWAEVLGIEENIIGLDANFFELGGQSLKAIILTAKIHKELNISLPLAEVFKAPTVRGLAQYIRKTVKDRYESIKPVEKKAYYVLSSAQARLYILQQMDLQSTAYNMPEVITLSNEVEINQLKQAFKRLIQRHDSLRTSFEMKQGEPVQRIYDEIEFEIEYSQSLVNGHWSLVNCQGRGEVSSPINVEKIIRDFIRPFDLSRAPLLRVGLKKLPHTPAALRGHPSQEGIEGKYLLLVDMHHIISDGISHQIVVRDFMELYEDQRLPFLQLQYKDFSVWQNSEKQKEKIRKQERYWLKEFEGEIPVLKLPLDFPRPAIQQFTGSTVSFEVCPGDTRALKNMVTRSDTTLFMILLTVFNILLSRLSSQEDIIIGTPIAGRRHIDLERIIGMFVNTLALRNYPNTEKKFSKFLQEVKDRTLQAFENQDTQFEDLVEKIEVARDVSRNPLFDTMMLFHNFDHSHQQPIPAPGLKNYPNRGKENAANRYQEFHYENRTAKFDLTLALMEYSGKILGGFNYCTHLFQSQTIERFTGYFKTIISRVCEDEDALLSDIEIIPQEEKVQLLIDFNRTETVYPYKKTIHELFAEQAVNTPDQIALVGSTLYNCPGIQPCQFTYEKLNEITRQLAVILRGKGIECGGIVAVMAESFVETILGIIGVLKADAFYVPLAPENPTGRAAYILKDSEVRLLLTTGSLTNEVPFEGEILDINTLLMKPYDNNKEGKFTQSSKSKDTPNSKISNTAYMIYTSGTTGKPKGVMVTHVGLVNYVTWFSHKIHLTGEDKTVLTSSLSFDLGYTSLYPSLLKGGQLHLISRDIYMLPESLLDYIYLHQITYLKLTPSLFSPMVNDSHFTAEKSHSLRFVVLGGEAIRGEDVEKAYGISKNLRVMNHYGPTEVTIGSIAQLVEREQLETFKQRPTIGNPIFNTKAFIIDKYFNLVPVGVTGELCLSGPGLAKGYFKQENLTSEKFIINRFMEVDEVIDPYKRMYRTGDLARWLPDGNIEFLGRIDHQIKIRGYRIETGEIENQLLKHPEIQETVVITMGRSEDKYLCAYVVLSPIKIPDQRSSLSIQLKKYLSSLLPDYMIPSFFIQVERIPLTPNGKLDRKALPQTEANIKREYTEPGNEIERELVNIWAEVLRSESLKIGIDTNFFEIGGHSLKATIMVSKIQQMFQVRVPLTEVFINPTIRGLAQYIEKMEPEIFTVKDPNLVLLKKTAANANNLFLVHDGSGEVEGYVEFCQHLHPPADFNCWGLRADIMGNNHYGPQEITIRELAKHYIEKIKKVQPQGPYCVAGWSLGGTIVFEMALQLEEMGEKISFLGLIDAPGPLKDWKREAESLTLASEIDWVREYLPDEEIEEKIKKAADVNEIWTAILAHLEEKHIRVEVIKRLIPPHLVQVIPHYDRLDIKELIYYLNINRTLVHARAVYIPSKKINAVLHYFKASQSPQKFKDTWNDYGLTPIRFYEVSGNHFSIIKKPTAAQWARLFDSALNSDNATGKEEKYK